MKYVKNGKALGETLPIEVNLLLLNWQQGIICPLFMKGDKASYDNYRCITLLSHVGKLYN